MHLTLESRLFICYSYHEIYPYPDTHICVEKFFIHVLVFTPFKAAITPPNVAQNIACGFNDTQGDANKLPPPISVHQTGVFV